MLRPAQIRAFTLVVDGLRPVRRGLTRPSFATFSGVHSLAQATAFVVAAFSLRYRVSASRLVEPPPTSGFTTAGSADGLGCSSVPAAAVHCFGKPVR